MSLATELRSMLTLAWVFLPSVSHLPFHTCSAVLQNTAVRQLQTPREGQEDRKTACLISCIPGLASVEVERPQERSRSEMRGYTHRIPPVEVISDVDFGYLTGAGSCRRISEYFTANCSFIHSGPACPAVASLLILLSPGRRQRGRFLSAMRPRLDLQYVPGCRPSAREACVVRLWVRQHAPLPPAPSSMQAQMHLLACFSCRSGLRVRRAPPSFGGDSQLYGISPM